MRRFVFVVLTILTYFGKVCSLQCYVPGECNFSPVIDVIIQPDQNELDGYSVCLINSIAYDASWFSFDHQNHPSEV